MTPRVFTLDEARTLLAELRPAIDEIVTLRADLVAAAHAHQDGDGEVALADVKGMEARLAELVDGFGVHGVEVRGWAPLLLDFPAVREGADVLLCWLEGESDIAWYHDPAHGFAGRRRLPA